MVPLMDIILFVLTSHAIFRHAGFISPIINENIIDETTYTLYGVEKASKSGSDSHFVIVIKNNRHNGIFVHAH